MRLPISILSALALASGAAILGAQDAHFGLQGSVSKPQSDLKDLTGDKNGYSAGISFPVYYENGHELRPRLDYGWTSGSATNGLGYTVDSKVKTAYLGVDYLYHFSQKNDGVYLLAGAGAANTKLETDDSTPVTGGSSSDNKTAFAWQAGLGWQFNALLGAELRYTATRPDFNGTTLNNSAIHAGLSLTF